ncbi:MAG: hypothetical protein QE271_01950 [Bacteriovoracaceae bacterium]|nr:hypothetical protein [Bacteriovoracaceae bacterium]
MSQLTKSIRNDAENFLKKSYLDHHQIDAKLIEYFNNRQFQSSFFSLKKWRPARHQSALGFILSFIGGVLVSIWLFFLLTFGFSIAKAERHLSSKSEVQISP